MVRSERIAEILAVLRSEDERLRSPDSDNGARPTRAIKLVEFQEEFEIPPLLFFGQLHPEVGRKIQRDPGRCREKARRQPGQGSSEEVSTSHHP